MRRWLSPLWSSPPPLAGMALDTLRREGFVALDLETTGLDARRDAVVAVAAIPFADETSQAGLVTLVNPGRPIPAESTRVHGITDEMVAGAPSIAEVLPALDGQLAGRVTVGHGVGFDLDVLARARRAARLRRVDFVAVDTMRLCAALHPTWANLALERVAAGVGIDVAGRHTAAGDAVIAGRLLLRLLDRLEARGARTVGELLWLQATCGL